MLTSKPSDAALRVTLAGWLNEFEIPTRSRGRDYYARGCVLALELNSEATSVVVNATVRGSNFYECRLAHANARGWGGECSCPLGSECKHLYAVGSAVLDRLAQAGDLAHSSFSGADAVPASTAEQTLVAEFTAATGKAPARKELAWLRNLLRLFQTVRSGAYHFDFQALQNLVPVTQRHGIFSFYENPFSDRWTQPPATPLELWSHFALILTERNVTLPPFAAKLTDVNWARAQVAAHRRERELARWRTRFTELEAADAATVSPLVEANAFHHLRLRLGRKKAVWEISDPVPVGEHARSPAQFHLLPTSEFRDLLESREEAAFTLEPASAAFAAMLTARFRSTNRTTFKLSEATDAAFFSRVLRHPLARTCVVSDSGQPITQDPRRLIWQFSDHPTDPDLTLARLAFNDGTPAPSPLLHLPGKTSLYLHDSTVFAGLPPLAAEPSDVAAPVPIPRAALELPEIGRLALRAGFTLPGDTASRFRQEAMRPRLRAQLAPRRPNAAPGQEVMHVELTAIGPDGAARARFDGGKWNRSGPNLPPPGPDDAFLILDFEPTRDAVEQLQRLSLFHDTWHPEGPRSTSEITSPGFPEAFAAWIAGFPSDTSIELAPELAALAQAPTRAHFALDLTPGTEGGIDWFDVRVTLRADDTTLTPEEIALLYAARGRFVRLNGRGWRRLTLDDSAATQEKLARLGLEPAAAADETGREPLRFHALQLADEALRDTLPEKLWNQVRQRSAALRALPPPEIPTGLVADLRPYQHEGFHFLSFLAENKFGGVLADDMGLGKTLQTLTWLLALASRSPGDKPFRVLVVCPKSVVVNWQLETARFAPSLTTTAFTSALVTATHANDSSPRPSSSGAAAGQLSALASHLLIANYAQLRLHADALASVTWNAVILDEGQNIKNPNSATAQAARALRTTHRLVLTGTPVENRLLDLWSLFAFAQPGLLGGQTAFKRLYNDKTDPGARTRLAQRVKHFLLRRTKSQVARDLPARIEEELIVELEGPQRTLYDAELKRTRALLLGVKSSREFDHQRFNILQSLLRLRQICCDVRLVGLDRSAAAPKKKSAARKTSGAKAKSSDAPSPPNEQPPLGNAKLEALLDTLEPLVAEGHKVLVFSQFVTMLELIRDELVARGIGHLLLTGQTENRQQLVDRFQTDREVPVFLLSLKAAGSGLNLTAASYVVLFDPWWNPAVEAQAIDRTHRIGQKNQVIAYRLIARDTVEEKIRALQKEKAALAAAVVQEESLASVLDLDSLKRILA